MAEHENGELLFDKINKRVDELVGDGISRHDAIIKATTEFSPREKQKQEERWVQQTDEIRPGMESARTSTVQEQKARDVLTAAPVGSSSLRQRLEQARKTSK